MDIKDKNLDINILIKNNPEDIFLLCSKVFDLAYLKGKNYPKFEELEIDNLKQNKDKMELNNKIKDCIIDNRIFKNDFDYNLKECQLTSNQFDNFLSKDKNEVDNEAQRVIKSLGYTKDYKPEIIIERYNKNVFIFLVEVGACIRGWKL